RYASSRLFNHLTDRNVLVGIARTVKLTIGPDPIDISVGISGDPIGFVRGVRNKLDRRNAAPQPIVAPADPAVTVAIRRMIHRVDHPTGPLSVGLRQDGVAEKVTTIRPNLDA